MYLKMDITIVSLYQTLLLKDRAWKLQIRPVNSDIQLQGCYCMWSVALYTGGGHTESRLLNTDSLKILMVSFSSFKHLD